MSEVSPRSWVRWVLGVLGVALVAGLVAARPLAGWGIRRWADHQGIELTFDQLTLESGTITLTDAELRLRSLEEIQVRSKQVRFHVKPWSPERLHLEEPTITFLGTPEEAQKRLSPWLRSLTLPWEMPLSTRSMTLIGRAPGKEPWLELRGITVEPNPGEGFRITVGSDVLPGSPRGVHFYGFKVPEGYEITFLDRPHRSPLRVLVVPETTPVIRVELARVGLRVLEPLGVSLPKELKNVEVEGTLTAPVNLGGPVTGKLHLDLHRYVPPHPPEVAPLVRGEKTTVDAELTYTGERGRGTLAVAPLVVSSGRLTMQGSGSAALEQGHAIFRGKLTGGLSCREVASSAAQVDLGDFLGGIAQGLAGLLRGEVRLSVQMEADSRNLAAASLRTHVTPHCTVSF
jgi:hypothetical protein